MRVSVLICALLALSGCSLLDSTLGRVAKEAGKAITYYCKNVPTQADREEFRARVNAVAAPNSVMVTCANDNPTLETRERMQ